MEGPLDLSGVAEFQAILDGFLDPIGIADDRGCFFWVNDASARFFGFEREELIGARFRDRLVEEEAPGDAMRRGAPRPPQGRHAGSRPVDPRAPRSGACADS